MTLHPWAIQVLFSGQCNENGLKTPPTSTVWSGAQNLLRNAVHGGSLPNRPTDRHTVEDDGEAAAAAAGTRISKGAISDCSERWRWGKRDKCLGMHMGFDAWHVLCLVEQQHESAQESPLQ